MKNRITSNQKHSVTVMLLKVKPKANKMKIPTFGMLFELTEKWGVFGGFFCRHKSSVLTTTIILKL